jgi:hypothetical protein
MPHEHNNHRNLKRPMTLRNQTPQIKIAGTLFRPAANNKSKLNAPRSNHNEKSPGTRRGSFMQRSKTDDSIVQPILAGAVSPASFLRSNRQNRALIQCRVNVGGAPSNLRIVSGGIPTLPAISSGVGSRPITCRMFRQVRTILFKASMVATDKWPSIIIPHPCRKCGLTRRDQQASGLSAGCAVHRTRLLAKVLTDVFCYREALGQALTPAARRAPYRGGLQAVITRPLVHLRCAGP